MNERLLQHHLNDLGYSDDEIEDQLWVIAEERNQRDRDNLETLDCKAID